jgi:hypothetical protein
MSKYRLKINSSTPFLTFSVQFSRLSSLDQTALSARDKAATQARTARTAGLSAGASVAYMRDGMASALSGNSLSRGIITGKGGDRQFSGTSHLQSTGNPPSI